MRSKLNTMAFAAAAVVGAAALARYLVRNSRCVDIAGKVVLITGGSRGLGLVLAREFASRGSRVAICARHERELEHVREEFSEQGKHLLALTCDVGVRAEVGRMVQTVREQLGPIDVFVNNAGAIVVGPAENQDLETFEDTMQTNFWGPFYAISAVVDQMKNRRHGRIVNIASIGG